MIINIYDEVLKDIPEGQKLTEEFIIKMMDLKDKDGKRVIAFSVNQPTGG